MKEMHDFTLVDRRPIGTSYVAMRLLHGGQMPAVEPGQFVEVRVDGAEGVMLRRPISVHDADPQAGTLTLLIQIVGRGPRRLAELEPGARVNLVYPLGHGFSLDVPQGGKVLMVGGGAGIAPLFYLARTLAARGTRPTVLLGGRTADLIPVSTEFEPYGEVCLTTDDGSAGVKGTVVEHPCFMQPYDMVYTCGPTPMMKAVARSAAARGIRCEASLENMMACGVGACLCCVVDTDGGHRRVCKEGPVFDISGMKKWYSLC